MNPTETLNTAIGWSYGSPLGDVLAVLTVGAFIAWFAWVAVSQLSRLRAREITIDLALAECARSLLTVIAVIAIIAYIN